MSLPCPPNTTAATALSTNPALVLALLRRVFSMYTTRSHGEQIQVLADVYAKDATATFEDPMMLVEGVDRIRVQFHALIKVWLLVGGVCGVPAVLLKQTPTIALRRGGSVLERHAECSRDYRTIDHGRNWNLGPRQSRPHDAQLAHGSHLHSTALLSPFARCTWAAQRGRGCAEFASVPSADDGGRIARACDAACCGVARADRVDGCL